MMDVCFTVGRLDYNLGLQLFVWEVQRSAETRASLHPPEPARVEYPVAYSWVSWRPNHLLTQASRKAVSPACELR